MCETVRKTLLGNVEEEPCLNYKKVTAVMWIRKLAR
jgi:hypothetical protein